MPGLSQRDEPVSGRMCRSTKGTPPAGFSNTHSRVETDLIVLGTHGLSGVDRAMLGSVTEKVLRKASCPVLTVPPAVETAAKVPYKRLLCPVDFSESSLNALRHALSLAEEADASLTILHVFDWPRDGNLLVERFDTQEFRRARRGKRSRRAPGRISERRGSAMVRSVDDCRIRKTLP